MLTKLCFVEKVRIKDASCWFLCSFIRIVPSFMEPIFNDICGEPATFLEFNFDQTSLDSLSKICQSSSAIRYLIDKGILEKWIAKAKILCDNIIG